MVRALLVLNLIGPVSCVPSVGEDSVWLSLQKD